MALVAAVCTNCGAQIEVNKDQDAGICTYCKTAFITEKAISQYVTNYQTTQIINKTIIGREKTEAEEYILNAETFLQLGERDKALESYKKASEVGPGNYKAWLGIFKIESKDYTDIEYKTDDLKKAFTVANASERQLIRKEVETYYSTLKNKIDNLLVYYVNWDISGLKSFYKDYDLDKAIAIIKEFVENAESRLKGHELIEFNQHKNELLTLIENPQKFFDEGEKFGYLDYYILKGISSFGMEYPRLLLDKEIALLKALEEAEKNWDEVWEDLGEGFLWIIILPFKIFQIGKFFKCSKAKKELKAFYKQYPDYEELQKYYDKKSKIKYRSVSFGGYICAKNYSSIKDFFEENKAE